MKAVLISIRPKWCELIASGKKTIEVRKTRPKIETPVKCYIYCTVGKGNTGDILPNSRGQCSRKPRAAVQAVSRAFPCRGICDSIECGKYSRAEYYLRRQFTNYERMGRR